MRVLFTSRPLHGHVQPLLPLAAALRDLGHEVGFATGPALLPTLRDMGYICFKAGNDSLTFEQRIVLFPQLATTRPQDQRSFFFPRIFAGIEALPRATDTVEVITNWRPSVLINEVAELGGPLAAARRGIPHATVGFGPPIQSDVLATTDSVVREYWASHGVTPATPAGIYDHLYLDPCPPSLQPAEPGVIPNRHGVRAGTGPRPDEASVATLTGFPTEGVIYATMGTVYGRDAQLFRDVIGGVAPTGRPLVVTSGPHVAPSDIGTVARNTLLVPFLAQAAVLARCDLVVTHGGAGSVLGALGFGVPLLVLPRGADHFYNAGLVERAGAGRWLEPGEVSADSIGREVQLLLADTAYRATARRIQSEINSMPSPAEAAVVLEDLAVSRA
jgi:UDP:flavonoid glycosyltransferase YjiC (YdhE family)